MSLIFVIFSISRREGENNGLLAGVPLLPPPSRVLSRPNSLPCGLVVKIWVGVSKVSSSNPGRTYSLRFFSFFSFSFRLFFFSVIAVFFCFFILLKFLDLQIFFSIALSSSSSIFIYTRNRIILHGLPRNRV